MPSYLSGHLDLEAAEGENSMSWQDQPSSMGNNNYLQLVLHIGYLNTAFERQSVALEAESKVATKSHEPTSSTSRRQRWTRQW